MNPDLEEVKRPPCCTLICFKFKTLCKALTNPIILKFNIFMILQGLMMPTFTDFDYYFALDVLGISKGFIGLQFIFLGVGILIMAPLYATYLANSEYKTMFFIS